MNILYTINFAYCYTSVGLGVFSNCSSATWDAEQVDFLL